MNVQINQLVKSLLQKDSLEQCSIQDLEQFVEQHPYFGAAQLLFTKKLQLVNSDRYDEQLQKTFLFFHNPMWVVHLLNETGNAQIIPITEKKIQPIVNPEPLNIEQIENPVISSYENVETKNFLSTKQLEDNTIVEAPVQQINLSTNTEEPTLQIPKLKIEPFNPAKEELLFEPFHTVDYFASQGIKFKEEEEKPHDKFSLQLKSFTDWLKTMKRLPVSQTDKIGEIISPVSALAEKKVEQLAEHSILGRNVITEAMAEVWIKQGNTDKAIEVYNKLSLLDPSKSLYFAAKIEDLKKTN